MLRLNFFQLRLDLTIPGINILKLFFTRKPIISLVLCVEILADVKYAVVDRKL